MSNNSYLRKHDAGLKAHHYAMTLDEVAREFGVTRERIRQIENRALTKARTILARRGYCWEDLLDGERHG